MILDFQILIFYLFRIPDPGVLKAPDPGSGSVVLFRLYQTGSCFSLIHAAPAINTVLVVNNSNIHLLSMAEELVPKNLPGFQKLKGNVVYLIETPAVLQNRNRRNRNYLP